MGIFKPKYLIVTLITFLFLFVSNSYAVTLSDEMVVINEMATYLVNNQNSDGGWDWTQPQDESGDTDADSGSTPNTAGATARGLVAAYNSTGNTSYLDAAVKTAQYIVDNTTTEVGAHKDILFMKELNEACIKAGVSNSYNGKTYLEYGADLAGAAVDIFNSGTYTNSSGTIYTWDTSGDLDSDIINAFNQFRGTETDAYAGLVPWEAGEWAQALYEIDSTLYGSDAQSLADQLFDLVIGDDDTFGTIDDGYTGTTGDDAWWYGLGLSGLLEGMGTVGSDQGDIDKVVAQLSLMGTYGDFQDAGYYALAMEIAGEKDLAIAAGLDIYNAYIADGLSNGYSKIYLEAVGEALHGLSSNPVPEPATMLLLGSGLALLGTFRKRFKKK